MMLRVSVLIFMMSRLVAASQQNVSEENLARLLADESTRREALVRIVNSESLSVPILLSWADNPPADVDKQQLYIGMAEAFGRLKTREAIPFLIKYINLPRYNMVRPNTWLKAPSVVITDRPAIAALIEFGSDASQPLIDAYWGPLKPEDRLAVIFAAAMIKGPKYRDFLRIAAGNANAERLRAEEGLKLKDEIR